MLRRSINCPNTTIIYSKSPEAILLKSCELLQKPRILLYAGLEASNSSSAYFFLTSIFLIFGLTGSTFGATIVRVPFSNFASILSSCIGAGK